MRAGSAGPRRREATMLVAASKPRPSRPRPTMPTGEARLRRFSSSTSPRSRQAFASTRCSASSTAMHLTAGCAAPPRRNCCPDSAPRRRTCFGWPKPHSTVTARHCSAGVRSNTRPSKSGRCASLPVRKAPKRRPLRPRRSAATATGRDDLGHAGPGFARTGGRGSRHPYPTAPAGAARLESVAGALARTAADRSTGEALWQHQRPQDGHQEDCGEQELATGPYEADCFDAYIW